MTPRDNDPWRRLREKEDEKEGKKDRILSKARAAFADQQVSDNEIAETTEALFKKLDAAQLLIDQVNGLYRQYLNGTQKMPPNAKRRQLDILVDSIYKSPKLTAAVHFRCDSLMTNYATHRDRWDRMIKDIEAGKTKRKLVGS
jgi:hypothetical protein